MTELVLLVGPPLVGKSLYCLSHFSVHYVRISIKEELESKPEVGLRYVINKAVTQLKQGKNVVIDDENGSKSKRISFIKVVKDKIPGCSIRCINLTPKCGYDQLLWTVAYLQATWLETHAYETQSEPCPYQENMLERWMTDVGDGSDAPAYGEGFNNIVDVSLEFVVHSYHKFEVPCLFIEYQGIVEKASDSVMDGVVPAIVLWCEANSCGCVVLIYGHVTGIHPTDKHEKMRVILKKIVSKLNTIPVFVLSVDAAQSSTSFFVHPQPGILALGSRLFHLDLSHKATMYLYSTQDHMKCADNAGVRYIRASRVFNHPKLVTSYTMATSPSIPEVLKNRKVTWPKTTAPEASMPLLSSKGDTVDEIHYSCCQLNGRISIHLCSQSKDSCESFDQFYQKHATPITEDGSRLEQIEKETKESVIENFAPTLEVESRPSPASSKSRRSSASSDTTTTTMGQDLPKWMVKKNISLNKMLDTPKKDRKSPRKTSQIFTTVYVMSPSELMDNAKAILQQGEGEAFMGDQMSENAEPEDLKALHYKPDTGTRHVLSPKTEGPRSHLLTPSDKSKIEQDLQKESFKFVKEEFNESMAVERSADSTAVFLQEDAVTPALRDIHETTKSSLDDIFSGKPMSKKTKPAKTRAVRRPPDVSDEDEKPPKFLASKAVVDSPQKKSSALDNEFSFLDDIF
ncbi:uncharacterized protein LOC135489512 [Lineus longissimus]|uniref:uncharacterized protein LOC135489512 n=1 Tax=Lineus longissimus TaxID=88925 RepID=UPI002B4F9F28